MKKLVIIFLILVLVLVPVLTGCGDKEGGDKPMTGKKREFPDDIAITSLKFQERSTAMLPYYIVRQEDDGYHWYVTTDDENLMNGNRPSNVVTDEAPVQELFRALLDAGILEWDGYNKSRSLGPGVRDGDSGFHLVLGLSDGSTLEAHGYNTYPDNYNEIEKIISEAFAPNQDYSEYYPTKMPEEQLASIDIKIGSPYESPASRMLKISLSAGWKQWAIVMKDPYGKYIDKEFTISAYDTTETPLPLEEFGQLLDKYDILSLNSVGRSPDNEDGDEYIQIFGYFEGDSQKLIDLHKSVKSEDYEDFIREFVDMTLAFYDTVKKD